MKNRTHILQSVLEDKHKIEEKAKHALSKLKHAIKKYDIDLKKLFDKFDKSDNDSLDISEFG